MGIRSRDGQTGIDVPEVAVALTAANIEQVGALSTGGRLRNPVKKTICLFSRFLINLSISVGLAINPNL